MIIYVCSYQSITPGLTKSAGFTAERRLSPREVADVCATIDARHDPSTLSFEKQRIGSAAGGLSYRYFDLALSPLWGPGENRPPHVKVDGTVLFGQRAQDEYQMSRS